MGVRHLSSQATCWLWELSLLLLSSLGASGGAASQTDRLRDGIKEVGGRGRGRRGGCEPRRVSICQTMKQR